MKYCPKCKSIKALDEFYNSNNRGDGKRAYCIECTKVNSKGLRNYYSEYRRKRYKTDSQFREKIIVSNKTNYRLKQKRANLLVFRALASGKIKRSPCVVCNTNTSIHAHHDDYTKPLDVIWLCPIHHRAWHINKNRLRGRVAE